ncbi:hypothetical protein D3C78_1505980 [compost metagenome]
MLEQVLEPFVRGFLRAVAIQHDEALFPVLQYFFHRWRQFIEVQGLGELGTEILKAFLNTVQVEPHHWAMRQTCSELSGQFALAEPRRSAKQANASTRIQVLQ